MFVFISCGSRFLDNKDDIAKLQACFAGLWSLDDSNAVKNAIEQPGAFVMKPQREGGGHTHTSPVICYLLSVICYLFSVIVLWDGDKCQMDKSCNLLVPLTKVGQDRCFLLILCA